MSAGPRRMAWRSLSNVRAGRVPGAWTRNYGIFVWESLSAQAPSGPSGRIQHRENNTRCSTPGKVKRKNLAPRQPPWNCPPPGCPKGMPAASFVPRSCPLQSSPNFKCVNFYGREPCTNWRSQHTITPGTQLGLELPRLSRAVQFGFRHSGWRLKHSRRSRRKPPKSINIDKCRRGPCGKAFPEAAIRK